MKYLRTLNLLYKNPNLIKPNKCINKINELHEEIIKSSIKSIIFDKDDTLVKLNQYQTSDQSIYQSINLFTKLGISLYVVSNAKLITHQSVTIYSKLHNNHIQIPIINTIQQKPYNGPEIIQYIQNKKQSVKIAIVGDRLLTDIYLGRTMGWNCYLIKPIQKTTICKHGLIVYLLRKLENNIVKYL